MDSEDILEQLNTEVYVTEWLTEEGHEKYRSGEQINRPDHLRKKSFVWTVNLSLAEILLQQDEFELIEVRTLHSNVELKDGVWYSPRSLSDDMFPDSKRELGLEILGVRGEVSGRPQEVATKIEKWGIDNVEIHRKDPNWNR